MSEINTTGWITSKQSAERLGVTNSQLVYLVRKGKLRGMFVGRRLAIDPQSVEQRIHAMTATEGLLSVSEVAKRIGITKSHASVLLKRGTLKGLKVEGRGRYGRWLVESDVLMSYLQKMQQRDAEMESLQTERSHLVAERSRLVAEGWLSPHDLMSKLGVSQQRIYQLLAAGLLPGAQRVGGRWFFPADTVEAHTKRLAMRRESKLKAKEANEAKKAKEAKNRKRHEVIPAGMLTVEQAAERLGVGKMTVYRHNAAGCFPGARKIGLRWFLPIEDVEALKVRREELSREQSRGRVERLVEVIPDGMLTVEEAAERLGIGKLTVLRHNVAGRFPGARKIGRRWALPSEDVEALKRWIFPIDDVDAYKAVERFERIEGWLAPKDVAIRLDVTTRTVAVLRNTGELAGRRVRSGGWLYDPASVEALIAQRARKVQV
ncbi:TPA: helix-turn-helix domain-containing protein [Burkholderia vietnamiensis]|nr:helix-turn-helix domain-containing protein [Burkholderia vietnamiensis]